jgi:hypothetical protein
MDAAIFDGALVHPGFEYGPDGAPQLLPRVVGKGLPRLLENDLLELAHQVFPVGGAKLCVELHLLLFFEGLDQVLKLVALHLQDHVGIHLMKRR